MYCPICREVEMQEVTKQGVLIDVCPRCRGVWLDRGEMEKILSAGREARRDYDEMYGHGEKHPDEARHQYKHDDHKYKKHHKKKSFFDVFEDIFD